MLFGKRKRELPPLISNEELEFATGVNYNTVTEWLVGLSDDDYAKICEVASIYRKADQDVCTALGVENKPVTFINQPEPVDEPISPEPDFITDDAPKPAKSKKIDVKQ